MLETLLNKF